MENNQNQVQVIEAKKNKSWQVIFTNANSMLGGGSLLVALYAKDQGAVLIPILICFIGILGARTCWLIVQHVLQIESSFSEMVLRLLGNRYKAIAEYSSGIFFFMAIISNYLLASNLLFNALTFIFQKANYTGYGGKEEINFSSFSYTWICIILAVIVYIVSHMKNLKIIIKISSFGFVSTSFFLFFIIYQFAKNVNKGSLKIDDKTDNNDNNDGINYVTFNIQDVYEVMAVLTTVFTTHSLGLTIFQQNENQANNRRDLYISYFVTMWVQMLISVLGYLGIYAMKKQKNPNTIFDYYTNNIEVITFISLCLYFCQELIFVILLIFDTKKTFRILINNYKKRPANSEMPLFDKIFNIITVLACVILGVLNISPKIAIACTGAFAAFFVVYYLPVFIHLSCVHGRYFFSSKKLPFQTNQELNALDVNKSLDINKSNALDINKSIEQQDFNEKDKIEMLNIKSEGSNPKIDVGSNKFEHDATKTMVGSPKIMGSPRTLMDPEGQIEIKDSVVCTHNKYLTGVSKTTRVFLNLAITIFGFSILIFQVVALIQSAM